jgi:hypothetical protein
MQEKVYVFGDDNTPGAVKPEGTYIRIYPMRAPAYSVPLWPSGTGGHAGGDAVMLADLFLLQKPADKYLRAADQRAGAYSILTGAAANHSIASGQPVNIADLVPGLALPDYPPMPAHDGPVPMPPKV